MWNSGKWDSGKIASVTGGELIGNSAVAFSGWETDSRRIVKGQAFAALRGENTDGHLYIEKAFAAGASVVLAEMTRLKQLRAGDWKIPEDKAIVAVKDTQEALQQLAKAFREELKPLVVGITGSNGKTTTKDMTAAVLSRKFRVHKNFGNYNNELGLPLTILNASPETEVMVLEMGMRGSGQIRALCDICSPSVGVITNIGTTHLELLGTRERIAEAKWELIESLPDDGIAVLNAEDYHSAFKSGSTPVKKVFFGIKGEFAGLDVFAENIRSAGVDAGLLNTCFEAIAGEERATVDLPLPGEHNVLDALAALTVGLQLGVSLESGAQALEGLQLSRMRLEVLNGIGDSVIINDVYNANPTSMKASLGVLAERGGEKTVAVLGEMYELGDAAISGHREAGQVIPLLGISELITVGELARNIAEGALDYGFPAEKITVCDNCAQAAAKAAELIDRYGPETWVLVKGSRGMKMESVSESLVVKKGI